MIYDLVAANFVAPTNSAAAEMSLKPGLTTIDKPLYAARPPLSFKLQFAHKTGRKNGPSGKNFEDFS